MNGAWVGVLCTVLTAILKQQSMCAATDKQGLPAAPCTIEEPGLALAGSMGSEESREVKVDGWGWVLRGLRSGDKALTCSLEMTRGQQHHTQASGRSLQN